MSVMTDRLEMAPVIEMVSGPSAKGVILFTVGLFSDSELSEELLVDVEVTSFELDMAPEERQKSLCLTGKGASTPFAGALNEQGKALDEVSVSAVFSSNGRVQGFAKAVFPANCSEISMAIKG